MRRIDPIQILLDEPIGGMTEDREDDLAGLGFGEYADVLAGVILGSASPFTMGVFGDWGTGKTTLMQMICERLIDYAPGKRPEKRKKPTIIPVWFDAWRYERETDLIGPLLGEILDATQKHAVDPTVRSVGNAAGLLVRAALRGVSLKLPGVGLDVTAEHFVEEYDRMVNELALPGSSEYRQAYRLLERQLRHLSQRKQASEEYGDNKFVVFVDDLDRCLPEAALQVLECTKVFLGFKGMVWVLGLKREIIENCIMERYRSKGEGKDEDERHPYGKEIGRQYLQKIIQVPFTIPKGTADEMVQLPAHFAAGEDLPEELGREFGPIAQPRDAARAAMYEEFDGREGLAEFEKSYHVATHYLEKKPRELKRLLNAYVVSARVTQASLVAQRTRQHEEVDEEPNEEVIAEYVQENFTPMLTLALLILRFLDEKLYDRLTMEPTLVPLVLTWRAAQRVGLKEAAMLGQEAFARAKPADTVPLAPAPDATDVPSEPFERWERMQPEAFRREDIAEFLLVTRLLEADPADIEAHARATSATAAPEEAPEDRGGTTSLAEMAADSSPTLRAGVARHLGSNFADLGNEERGIVRQLAKDTEAQVRAELAVGLGLSFEYLDEEGRGIVGRLAEDVPEVRAGLIEGLRDNTRLGEEGDGLLAELLRRQAEEGEEK